ncbi:MAG: guanine deaminase [Thermoanaerobaculia bacterium]
MLFRGRLFSPTARAFTDSDAFVSIDDACVAVEEGRIVSVGPWSERPRDGEVVEYGSGCFIVPGFVDLHLHAPQLEMIGSYGGHLLEWLQRYTFPNEAKFAERGHAERVARWFFDELLGHGTLTALLFSTTHTGATEALFEEAARRGFRAILGKTMMDRNAPEELIESPDEAYRAAAELIRRWHGQGRLGYAITPRFAPTSTPRLLQAAGALRREFPDAWVQTHLSENVAEIEWVTELFPDARNYADVYDRYGLLGPKTVLAHAVHVTDGELETIRERDGRIAHCPNSNLFLGSGLFPMQRIVDRGIPFGLGTDIGAGTTLSMFEVMADAYKVQQVLGTRLRPLQLWYLATLGGAAALGLDGETGSLEPGKSADFIVLDASATPLLASRVESARDFEDLLGAFVFLADDRALVESRIGGERVWSKEGAAG